MSLNDGTGRRRDQEVAEGPVRVGESTEITGGSTTSEDLDTEVEAKVMTLTDIDLRWVNLLVIRGVILVKVLEF